MRQRVIHSLLLPQSLLSDVIAYGVCCHVDIGILVPIVYSVALVMHVLVQHVLQRINHLSALRVSHVLLQHHVRHMVYARQVSDDEHHHRCVYVGCHPLLRCIIIIDGK